jgi:hypothetical protein
MRILLTQKLFIFYSLILILLLLYSFTQIDLGLTLIRDPAFYPLQHAFQSIGYFNRSLSTFLYGTILLFLFAFYFLILYKIHKREINRKALWVFILFSTILLVFSYNAFSYDIFNYIFDAKIFTFYHQNPYLHKALDYTSDPMLRFMHWTHRTYPYGPLWLAVSIPISYLGFNIFLVTFFLFKLLAGISYLGTTYFLEKIMDIVNPKAKLSAISFFALNPLVLIESLVSGHNDIFMIFLVMISLYLLIKKKYIMAFFLLILSIFVKYTTVFLFPVFLAIVTMQVMKEKIYWKMFLGTAIGCLSLGVIAASQLSGNFQPWYLLVILPFSAILIDSWYVVITTIVISITALLTYIPFLYNGNWNPPIPQIILYIEGGGILLIFIASGIIFTLSKKGLLPKN